MLPNTNLSLPEGNPTNLPPSLDLLAGGLPLPDTSYSGFKLVGNRRFLAWYTNPYQDRDHEWFSEKAIDTDIMRMQQAGAYPELWFCHTSALKFGQCDAVFKTGRFAIATGTLDNTSYADALAEYATANGFKLSHGFTYDPSQFWDNTYHQYNTFEVSVLPSDAAANPFTFFANPESTILGEKTMAPTLTPELERHIKQALAPTGVTLEQLMQAGTTASKTLDKTVSYKASPLEDALLETEAPEAEAPAMEMEVETPSAPLPTDPAQMRAFLKSMGDMMKMVTDMKTMMDKAFATSADKAAPPAPKEEVVAKEEVMATEEQKAIHLLIQEVKALKEAQSSKAQSVQTYNILDALTDFNTQGQKQTANTGAFDPDWFTNNVVRGGQV